MKEKENKTFTGNLEDVDKLLSRIKPDDDFEIIILRKNNGGVVTY
jgi:hypothetical protein